MEDDSDEDTMSNFGSTFGVIVSKSFVGTVGGGGRSVLDGAYGFKLGS